jgi:hypothetical protein
MPSANASFNLTDARFMYGPMQAWPRWPNPPIVEITALHALLPHGTWLRMADGLKPKNYPQECCLVNASIFRFYILR